jgi:hypothetical protein
MFKKSEQKTIIKWIKDSKIKFYTYLADIEASYSWIQILKHKFGCMLILNLRYLINYFKWLNQILRQNANFTNKSNKHYLAFTRLVFEFILMHSNKLRHIVRIEVECKTERHWTKNCNFTEFVCLFHLGKWYGWMMKRKEETRIPFQAIDNYEVMDSEEN